MARYLDPKNDLTFKRIFGEHPDLLKSFLNALMPLEERQRIEDLKYLTPEQVPDTPAKKNSIVDVRCTDSFGRQFIVEMQVAWTPSFTSRMVFNAAKSYVRQLDKKEDYRLLTPVYGLAILDDTFDKQTEEFYHHYKIVNQRNTSEVIKGLEFVLVELPKFRPERWASRRMGALWLRFLKEVEDSISAVSADLQENDDIRRALDMCEAGAFTEAELQAYDAYWDIVRVERTLIVDSRAEGEAIGEQRGIAIGKAEGEAIGRAEGEAIGKAIGKAEGKAEGEAIGRAESLADVVRNCKRKGFSLEQLQEITGLGEEQILAILRASAD
jgi:predicted transposase/invertase (TIGR01784 family)